VHLSPIDEKLPTLIAWNSALNIAPYQMVAYLDKKTSPAKVAFGATQASSILGAYSYRGRIYLCLERFC